MDSEVMTTALIVHAPKRIDFCTAPFLAEDLEVKIQEGNAIVLDLTQTQFLDPEGTNVVLQGLLKSKQRHARFSLRGVKPQVKVILELAGVLQYFRQK